MSGGRETGPAANTLTVFGVGAALYPILYRAYVSPTAWDSPFALKRNIGLTVVAGVALLHVWRRSVGTLLALAAAAVSLLALNGLRATPNSALFYGAVMAYVAVIIGARRLQRDDAAATYLPIAGIRRCAIVLYAFSALAKLNRGFILGAHQSCAAWGYENSRSWFPFLPSGAFVWEVAGLMTFGAEAAVPVLLAFRRTRLFGVLLAFCVHLAFGIVPVTGALPHWDFSAMAFPILFVCLPSGVQARSTARLEAVFANPHVKRAALVGVTVFALFAANPWASGGGAHSPASAKFTSGKHVWLAYALAAAYVVARSIRRRDIVEAPAWTRSPSAPLGRDRSKGWVPVAVLTANALCPYVGLKTESSFLMYSNLRTEQGYWNHLWIPESVRVLGFQEPIVQIVKTNTPSIEEGIMPRSELEWSVAARTTTQHEVDVTYVEGGVPRRIRSSDVSAAQMRWWKLRGSFLVFRPVPAHPVEAPASLRSGSFTADICTH